MKFNVTLSATLFVIAASVSAAPTTTQPKGFFSVAPGAPEGLYTHHVSLDGTLHTEYHGKPNLTSSSHHTLSQGSRHTKRDRALGVVCQNLVFTASDAQNAVAGLANALNTSPTFYHSISYTSGTATAYGCDYSSGQTISGPAMSDYLDLVKLRCGDSKEGYYGFGPDNAAYGITTSGSGFC